MKCGFITVLLLKLTVTVCNEDAKRLHQDLLMGYNKLSMPSAGKEALDVKFRLKLAQILDLNEKSQIITTNVWLYQEWRDRRLTWNTSKYAGVDVMYLPADAIWVPDIVLFNNADGNYKVRILVKVKIRHTGKVTWEPPAIFNSMCPIDVEWFPFDRQICSLKFGSWTHNFHVLNLLHGHNESEITHYQAVGVYGTMENVSLVKRAIDLEDFYPSVEFDLMAVPGSRHQGHFPCCPDAAGYVQITFSIVLRRKIGFYIVNFITPCISISLLTFLTFYLPAESREKIVLCVSILISLTVFFLLMVEIIPATGQKVPLMGKYLLFTMILITASIVLTVITINVHFRTPVNHVMPKWMSWFFMRFLPRILFLEKEAKIESYKRKRRESESAIAQILVKRFGNIPIMIDPRKLKLAQLNAAETERDKHFQYVHFIENHFKDGDKTKENMASWQYIALVLDRTFLFCFSAASIIGSLIIFLQAPYLYDSDEPLA